MSKQGRIVGSERDLLVRALSDVVKLQHTSDMMQKQIDRNEASLDRTRRRLHAHLAKEEE